MEKITAYIHENRLISILVSLIVILVAARMAFLPITPPGFYLDEAATGAHVVSMLHGGANAHGEAWPLYSESLGGGYTTPIYLYPLVGWASVFGDSELALRYFSMVMTIIAILLLGCAVRLWLDGRSALITAIAGLALPWGWLQGSLAWDPALLPLIIAVAFAAFSLLLFSGSRFIRGSMLVILPLALLALAYLYPPARLTGPLLFIGAYFILARRGIVDIRSIAVTALASAVVALPLVQFMMQPAATARAQELNVFHNTSLINGLWQAILNMLNLVNPWLLFVGGDPNLRHSTGFEGMLGFAAVPPLIALIVAYFVKNNRPKIDKKIQLLIWTGVFGIVAGIIGSAFTNESQPHSLRATAAWPFWLLLITVGWHLIASRWTASYVKSACVIIAVTATGIFVMDYTLSYPTRAASSFDTEQRAYILRGITLPPQYYPDLAQQYYRLR